MARARNIKPGFFDNPEIGKLDSDIRLLLIALWQLADLEGVIEYHPSVIRRHVFGYRLDITDEDVNRYITVLSQLGNNDVLTICFYSQKQYLVITDFEDEQSPHHTEKKGRLPSRQVLILKGSEEVTVTSPLDNGYSYADSGFLIPDSISSGTNVPKEISIPPPEKVPKSTKPENYRPEFLEFWQLYPKNGASKAETWKSYQRAIRGGAQHEDIARAVRAYTTYLDRTRTPTAHATTWLNNERWTVDYETIGGKNGAETGKIATGGRYGNASKSTSGVDTFLAACANVIARQDGR